MAGEAKNPVSKADTGKAKQKSRVKITPPKMSMMTWLGLAGVNLAALPLKAMPEVLDKISSKVKALPGGDAVATACDGAKTGIEAYLTAVDVFNGLMLAITAVQTVSAAGLAMGSMGMTVPETVAKIAGALGAGALTSAKDVIPTAMKSIQNASVEVGEDGQPKLSM